MTTKLSDYVFARLVDEGVRHVFMITGGGAMHLNDSAGAQQGLQIVCHHHEQACAMAAEAYARITGRVGVVSVTTGPGGINALSGVMGAWTDSIPLLVISGQVKRATCMASYDLPGLRQLGDQEVDIVAMARPITKYAALVDDPLTIRMHLDAALRIATSGRPGPCWIDVPIDVQAAQIDVDTLAGEEAPMVVGPPPPDDLPARCAEVIARMRAAERPVVLAGSGIHLAGALDLFTEVTRLLGAPVTTGWTALDLIATDDPLFAGRPGTVGDRAGNFTVQNATDLLVLGCRLNIRQVSYRWEAFAPDAFVIQVDIDPAELRKPTVRPDLPIVCDLAAFLAELRRQLAAAPTAASRHTEWLSWCRQRVARYRVVDPARHRSRDGAINPYELSDRLIRRLGADDVVVCGNGAASVVPFQVAHVRRGQRYLANSGCASMGYDLPAAIGAAFAHGKRVICFAGDGSMQMNLQELQTIVHHRLPIKIVVLDNGGYLSIRTTQRGFFGRCVGESAATGVSFPDPVAVARAYGIEAFRLDRADYDADLDRLLAADGPLLCHVVLDRDQEFEPRSKARQLPDGSIVSPPLEDMYPFLDRDELAANRWRPR